MRDGKAERELRGIVAEAQEEPATDFADVMTLTFTLCWKLLYSSEGRFNFGRDFGGKIHEEQ